MDEHLDVRIAEAAARQHGVVKRSQLIAAGATKAMIEHRIAIRRLRPVHAGVYAVGHRLALYGRYLAAVYACGPGTLLSHRCSAAMSDLRRTPSGHIDVTVTRLGARPKPGINVHRTRILDPDDVVIRDGIPCTSVARTLVDLADVAPDHELRRALERAVELQVFDARALDSTMTRLNGRRGIARLRRALAYLPDDPPLLRTEIERRFLDLVRQAGLPIPVVNAYVRDHEVDFHWPAHRLIVETDGAATHATRLAFEQDRARDLDLQLAGWRVMRFTWRQVTRQPARVKTLLRTALSS